MWCVLYLVQATITTIHVKDKNTFINEMTFFITSSHTNALQVRLEKNRENICETIGEMVFGNKYNKINI